MSFIQNFYTSRDNNTDGNTYVGQEGRLWYNPLTNSIYVNTANVVGGTPVALATGANIVANIITVNTITSTGGNIAVTGNLVISGNISPATETKIGGVKAGPGANISNDGTLTINTAGLSFSFGDFTANTNILTLVNEDQNMILATKGSAEIQLVGNIGFYKTDGFPPNVANRFFYAQDDGQITILVPDQDPLLGAVQITGSATGESVAPGIIGAMLHVTGQPDIPCRNYYDGNGNYVSWVARRWNSNVAAGITQVLAGDDVLRINATAATDAGMGNVAFVQISASALEDQTTTAQGSELSFIVTPVGQPATNRVEVANVTVANGVSATKFTGNLTGNVTGTATTATSLTAATSILAGSLTINPTNIGKNSASTQTFTLTGLTTSHKIVITCGTALTFGVTISAAWASALNTLSIEFQNATGGGVDLGNTDIQYFAWV